MCGIVAIHSADGGLDGSELAAPMAELRPRGPDGEGTWVSPAGRAALGHTRLAVIAPAAGHQPVAGPHGAVQLVANGEFYGYREIRRELESAGCRFRTGSDSEIALHLYLRDGGERALERLRGEFAFVLWDERHDTLFASRDRFGVKPLYYTERGGRLYVASEIKALLACGAPTRWDTAAFAAHLQLGLPTDRTLFTGIRQLPPGCSLTADVNGVRIAPYWDLDYPPGDELATGSLRPEEHLAAVREQFEEAVRLRTVADVPLACHLSGGIDSTAVAACAAHHTGPGGITAFTVRFDDPAYDESPVARRTAAALGIAHREVPSERARFADHLRDVVRAGEMVQENAHGIARHLHSAHIKKEGFTAVLAGEGGDELFLGYPQFRKDLALSLSGEARARAARGYARLDGVLPAYLRGLLGTLGFLPTWIVDRHLTVVQPLTALLRPEFAAELAAADAAAPLLADGAARIDGRAPVHQAAYLFAKSRLPGYLLAAERLDAAQAVEVRMPFFDHHLFDVVRHTPLAWYDRDGAGKYPLRAALHDRLPREVAEGAKRGFFAPPVVDDDSMLAALREHTDDAALRDNPFFEPHAVRTLLDRLADAPPGRRATGENLLQLVAGTVALAEEFGLTTAQGEGKPR
ncbi:asparagine synthase (glutamine-hydrolyzing) [Streptomyces sp. NPDC052396]|uniref:asparagine synthase (glutamine-hydrolyzing) n=1 Tax=Streptomyces sp. NPDC052396 TaxID=3365689 RepID=UPI0037CF8F01